MIASKYYLIIIFIFSNGAETRFHTRQPFDGEDACHAYYLKPRIQRNLQAYIVAYNAEEENDIAEVKHECKERNWKKATY